MQTFTTGDTREQARTKLNENFAASVGAAASFKVANCLNIDLLINGVLVAQGGTNYSGPFVDIGAVPFGQAIPVTDTDGLPVNIRGKRVQIVQIEMPAAGGIYFPNFVGPGVTEESPQCWVDYGGNYFFYPYAMPTGAVPNIAIQDP